jgi:hypothetical protein
MNKALKMSCLRGLPVRVVRSFKVRSHGIFAWHVRMACMRGLPVRVVRSFKVWMCECCVEV